MGIVGEGGFDVQTALDTVDGISTTFHLNRLFIDTRIAIRMRATPLSDVAQGIFQRTRCSRPASSAWGEARSVGTPQQSCGDGTNFPEKRSCARENPAVEGAITRVGINEAKAAGHAHGYPDCCVVGFNDEMLRQESLHNAASAIKTMIDRGENAGRPQVSGKCSLVESLPKRTAVTRTA